METKHGHGHSAASEGYERSDASTGGLLKFAFWLFVVLLASLLGMKWMFSFFAKVQPLGPPASPFENARVLPPSPRLQVEPKQDLEKYLEAQQEILNSYGWVDEHNGIVHIPIDRAMDLALERGFPARAGAEGTGSSSAGQAAGAAQH